MNITSMNGQELYKLIFGKETAIGYHLSDENKEKISSGTTAALGDIMELSTQYKTDPDTSSIVTMFETGGYGKLGELRFQNSLQPLTDDQLAQHIADIGRRLDSAYSEGKITEEEYNELNANMSEYISYQKDKNDFWRAAKEVSTERRNADWQLIMQGLMPDGKLKLDESLKHDSEESRVHMEEWLEAIKTRQSKISTNMDAFMKMIDNYRNDTSTRLPYVKSRHSVPESIFEKKC